jgi:predicted RNase H-like HicB family nuclease
MGSLSYTIVLEPAEEGGFVVSVPALSGCYTQGDSYDEAIAMAQDAIRLWVEDLAQEGQPIPSDEAGAGVRILKVDVVASVGL